MKKTSLLLSLMLLSTAAMADFSETAIGTTDTTTKDFNRLSLENIHRGTKELVLTFDDGPTPGVTNKVLDVLQRYNVKATFFVIANKVNDNRALMARILDEGHIVANHSLSHKALRDLRFFSWKKVVNKEIMEAHDILAPYMSNSNTYFYRAPEGAWDTKYAQELNQHAVARNYIGPVLWDIGGSMVKNGSGYSQTADWACWAQKLTVEECLSGYVNESRKTRGGVVLMHDLRSSSAEMLAKYIPQMLNEGFVFKNLDDVNFRK